MTSRNGVYCIRHIDSGHTYVGSCSSKQGIDQRWRVHRNELNSSHHHSRYLQRAWNKYGADSFVFEVLLYCDPQDCLMYEQIALGHFKPAYNTATIAGSRLGTTHSRETKQRMSINRRGKNLGVANPNYGRKRSNERKKLDSILNSGERNNQAKLTQSQVDDIRLAVTNGITQRELANHYGVSEATISRIVHQKSWKVA